MKYGVLHPDILTERAPDLTVLLDYSGG